MTEEEIRAMIGNATGVNLATVDLPTRCAECTARIDRGDLYRIVKWDGGFDYVHADCSRTAFTGFLERGKP